MKLYQMAGWAMGTAALWACAPMHAGVVLPKSLFYASFVEWNYDHLPRLKAWRETERLISMVLTEKYGPNSASSGAESANGSKKELTTWAKELSQPASDAHDSAIEVIYLAAHQSPIGQWCLADDSVLTPDRVQSDLLGDRKVDCVIFLDTCFSKSAYPFSQTHAPAGPGGKPGKLLVFAAQTSEPTPDSPVYHRTPVDWQEHCPHAFSWLKEHHFGGSDERLSFMGIIWLEAFLTQPNPPASLAEWREMAQTMSDLSAKVQKDAPSGTSSSISFN